MDQHYEAQAWLLKALEVAQIYALPSSLLLGTCGGVGLRA